MTVQDISTGVYDRPEWAVYRLYVTCYTFDKNLNCRIKMRKAGLEI